MGQGMQHCVARIVFFKIKKAYGPKIIGTPVEYRYIYPTHNVRFDGKSKTGIISLSS
jgi:hypothetical protein